MENNSIKVLKFEECLPIIEREIQKRKSKWTLDAIAWMDWEDVSQNLRIHIANKFEKWDQARPLQNWLARVIHNQLVNAIRNHYSNFSPICNKCQAFDGCDECSIYSKQRDNCPLFANWKKTKLSAYNVKLPLSSFYHEQELHDIPHDGVDMDKAAHNIHIQMKTVLKLHEYKIYSMLFIDHKTEQEVADRLPFSKNRNKDLYKVKQLKKKFVTKVRQIIYAGEIDIR